MTSQPAYPGYATPSFRYANDAGTKWYVVARPWGKYLGVVHDRGPVGCEAFSVRHHRVGLFPDKQAAGEALVKHAGYEVLG